MKRYMKSLKKIMIVLTLGSALAACESFTNGVSEFDPTQPTNASLGQVINSGEVAYIGFMEGELARIAGMWSGQFTGADRQYVALNNYTSTAPDYDNAWGNIYAGALKALRIAQGKAAETNNRRALALAQILEAHTMVTTAAIFGDVPYSQANDLVNYPNPAFDTQMDVYNATLTLLDAALNNIKTAPKGTAYDGDIFFSGGASDDAIWTAVANTVKAKIYLHLGQYQKALDAANLGITSPDDEVIASHGTSYNLDINIYASFLTYDRPGYLDASAAFAPRLIDPGSAASRNNSKTIEDDRFAYTYLPVTNDKDETVGYELNYNSEEDWGEPDGFFGIKSSFPLISYRENQLIIAEAALRTSGFADGLDALNEYRAYLNDGGYINPDLISGEDHYLAYDAADFASGGIENAANLTPEDALYKEIVEEKYVSLLGTIEVFNDMRRTGYGSFAGKENWQVLGITPNTGSEIPQRFLISQVEINSNTSAPRPSPGLFEKTAVFK